MSNYPITTSINNGFSETLPVFQLTEEYTIAAEDLEGDGEELAPPLEIDDGCAIILYNSILDRCFTDCTE